MSRLPLLMLLLADTAIAGGYYFPDSGVVATGRGGAFVASADDTFAQYYNPAALSRLDRWQIDLGVSAVSQKVEFTRLMSDDSFADPVNNEGGAFVIPQFGVGGPLIEDKLHLAVGLYTAYSPSFKYDPTGPQRYTLSNSSILQGFAGPSLSLTPVPWMSVGLGLQWQFLSVGQDLTATTKIPDGTEDPTSDIDVSVRQLDPFSPSANLGVLIQPVDELSIGLAVQLPSSFQTKGSMRVDFSGHTLEDYIDFDDPSGASIVTDDDVRLAVNLPVIIKAGVAVHPSKSSAIEVAVVYENWKSLDSLTLSDVQLDLQFKNEGFPQPDISDTLALPTYFRDTVSLRLGGSVDLLDELTLRAGGFYETSSQADAHLSVANYAPSKFQLSGGASVHLIDERLSADVSIARLFFASKQVRDSDIRQTNVQGGTALVVGNGDYRSSGLVLAGGLSWAFGKRSRG